ncbi:hypothetical protein BD779DRAFT_1525783 [Infundibulicybe gibba]|nr:hypothetical protein BD779DRAFT_1525783 [Infundibulicybe gibba]
MHPIHQPQGFDGGSQAIYSPALPTSLQHSFHPSFPMSHHPMQTPMQNHFAPQPPFAPVRPTHQHGQPSMSQLTAAGMSTPMAFPMTPVGGHFSRPSMMLGPNQAFMGQQSGHHPFPNRTRRQPSIGGPPKAALGGPARKLSPLPTAAATSASSPTVPPVKPKKVVINLPKETVLGENGQPETRPSWARVPLPDQFIGGERQPLPAEISSGESYPPEEVRRHLPNVIDVFLPGKRMWETIKQQAIEEKLEKLGVERGSGSNMPHIHAPHARAASISSTADHAVQLMFKLNKLQQSQENSAVNSLSGSPQPPFGLSPSPHRPAPRFMTNKHGHSMSLAQPPTYSPLLFDPFTAATNPFGPNAVLGSDQLVRPPLPTIVTSVPQESIHAPQGRAPLSAVRPDSRPDFVRGFGLDIPEEDEEAEAQEKPRTEEIQEASGEEIVGASNQGETEQGETNEEEIREPTELAPEDVAASADISQDMELEEEEVGREIRELEDALEGPTTAVQSVVHSRHASRLSVEVLEEFVEETAPPGGEAGLEEDAVEEWTGSEDLYMDGDSSDESIGEWSNPSDEERARQKRVERRLRRPAVLVVEEPRRLPNFPRPPQNTMTFGRPAEDDIISNPSEEGQDRMERVRDFLGASTGEYSRPPSNMSMRSNRPLPPIPHSRVPSSQFSLHDPAQAHSRSPSENFVYPGDHQQQSSLGSRRDTLNPYAKPFVFGASRSSQEFGSLGGMPTPPKAPLIGHTRLPSFGRPLNVAAAEFKPTGFTFRPPPGVPPMPQPISFPVPEFSRPLPEPPYAESSPFKVQGREKRQRRASSGSMEEGDSMISFRFPPNVESPQSIRRMPSPHLATTRSHHSSLNPSAEPFTFASFSAVAGLPYVRPDSEPQENTTRPESPEVTFGEDNTAKPEDGEVHADMATLPTTSKPKRTPIPLDFKHPVSSNTVPAGLFKALVNNGDDRTRKSVRSRLSSREIFEHVRRPSMDDLDVPTISRKVSRARLVTDPSNRQGSPVEDVFGGNRSHTRRRSSLPDDLMNDGGHRSMSDISAAADLTTQMAIHKLEDKLADLLDKQVASLRHEMLSKSEKDQEESSKTSAMISELISLFRTQLQQSATRGFEDSQLDARGEMDFQLLKDVVEESQRQSFKQLKQEMDRLECHLRVPNASVQDIAPFIENSSNRTVASIVDAISDLSARLETVARSTFARDRDATVDMLLNALRPVLASVNSEPVDYDLLTSQLTQAVKPHITQLIDLASDKRETAGLIVDRLIPLLSSFKTPSLDTDALTLQLVTEVRHAIAPIDAHVIKEHVADLVVERLDSRLAVRDKTFNIETVTSNVAERVAPLLEPVKSVANTLEQLLSKQESAITQQTEFRSTHNNTLSALQRLESKISESTDTLTAARDEIYLKLDQPKAIDTSANEVISTMKTNIDNLVTTQKSLSTKNDDIASAQQDLLLAVKSLPETLFTATKMLQNGNAEFIASLDSSKRELDEARKANSDTQIQLAKARSAHGQIRVEKEALSNKLNTAESERDHLRTQIKELQSVLDSKSLESATLETRNAELEAALAQALSRLQASDVATQASQDRIAELEKTNRELLSEKSSFKTKVDSLELQVTFAARDKESAVQNLEHLQRQHDQLLSDQAHWDTLRQTSEKIDLLTTLIGQADQEELKELRRHRERGRILEADHAALQRRFKDHETKVMNSERAASAARQSLGLAQQRASEWERRAKEYEGRLESTQTQLDQADQIQSQLDADYSLVKLQLEEREADERLLKDQTHKLHEQISNLETQVTNLKTELAEAKEAVPATPAAKFTPLTNGSSYTYSRPDSRTSTNYDPRSATPNGKRYSSLSQNSSIRSNTPPNQASVWDSMHAPTNVNRTFKPPVRAAAKRYPNLGPATPKARRTAPTTRASMPSPTPSTVSLALTQDEDGWYNGA